MSYDNEPVQYVPNPACPCVRCAARHWMGAAILITMGLLFLLQNFHAVRLHTTWPILLIVIGLMQVLRSNGPTQGHVNAFPTSSSSPIAVAPAGAGAPTQESESHHV